MHFSVFGKEKNDPFLQWMRGKRKGAERNGTVLASVKKIYISSLKEGLLF
jgi:hypothetical protein